MDLAVALACALLCSLLTPGLSQEESSKLVAVNQTGEQAPEEVRGPAAAATQRIVVQLRLLHARLQVEGLAWWEPH